MLLRKYALDKFNSLIAKKRGLGVRRCCRNEKAKEENAKEDKANSKYRYAEEQAAAVDNPFPKRLNKRLPQL